MHFKTVPRPWIMRDKSPLLVDIQDDIVVVRADENVKYRGGTLLVQYDN